MKTKSGAVRPSETRGHPGCNQDAESYAAYGPNPRWEVVDDGGDPSRPHSGGLFPDSVEFRIPGHLERPYDAPAGWMCVYECMFTEFGMNFPLSPLFLQFAADRGVPTSQLTHGVVRHIVFTEALARAAGVVFDRLFLSTTVQASETERLKEKFRLLKELSHRLWPEVVAALEKKKQERKDKREGKSKSAIPATPISTKPSRSKKKRWVLGRERPCLLTTLSLLPSRRLKRKGSSPQTEGFSSFSPSELFHCVAASTRKASTSVPEGVPEQVIELDSPPSSDHDESSHHDESASHHDDGLRTPARGGSPSKGDEFLTPGGGVPSSDRRDRGGFEGGESSRRPGENDEAASRHSEAGGFAPGSNLGAEGAGIQRMDACGGATWMSKVHPGLGIPREELTFRTDFDEAAQHHIMSGGKFTALVQKYETALRAAKDEGLCVAAEREMAKMSIQWWLISRINWLESKVAALNREIVKTLGLQEVADKLRAQVSDLEEKAVGMQRLLLLRWSVSDGLVENRSRRL
ncbi:unnamed protein product [Microthlaspi erraticum]|uniref:Uncharacterized protein n=1 Tax=Microthlaspi erraticum TaxID=1685480 RepID=A0A6D2JSH6_9BRAS|nr:unnamed protein product [Microthlaspi erraticum]